MSEGRISMLLWAPAGGTIPANDEGRHHRREARDSADDMIPDRGTLPPRVLHPASEDRLRRTLRTGAGIEVATMPDPGGIFAAGREIWAGNGILWVDIMTGITCRASGPVDPCRLGAGTTRTGHRRTRGIRTLRGMKVVDRWMGDQAGMEWASETLRVVYRRQMSSRKASRCGTLRNGIGRRMPRR